MDRVLCSLVLVGFLTSTGVQSATFSDVKVRFVSAKERKMDEKGASLTLDDGARRLQVTSRDRPLDVSYDDVQQVVIEVDTYGRKTGFGASMVGLLAGGLLFGGMIATAIDKPFEGDHLVYFDYRKPDGTTAPYLLTVGAKSVPQALTRLKAAFGDRVRVPIFDEKMEPGDKTRVAPSLPRISRVNPTDKQHPVPELRPDKALVVVAVPGTALRRASKNVNLFPLVANDVLVAFTGPGTYTFFYLDPGENVIVGRVINDAPGMRTTLEAGRDYYLTQTLYVKGFLAQCQGEIEMSPFLAK